jgi:integral membrane sensor domain MASE1
MLLVCGTAEVVLQLSSDSRWRTTAADHHRIANIQLLGPREAPAVAAYVGSCLLGMMKVGEDPTLAKAVTAWLNTYGACLMAARRRSAHGKVVSKMPWHDAPFCMP